MTRSTPRPTLALILAVMATLVGLLPGLSLRGDLALPVPPSVAFARPDDDEDEGGGDDDEDTDDEDSETEDESDDEDTDESEDDESDDEKDLPDAVKQILKKNRQELRDAKKALKAEKAKNAKPAPKKKPKPATGKDGDDGPDAVTVALRKAGLKSALADEGITGPQAKAAIRLLDLDDVEFDDDHDPTNLDDVLEAAEKQFGKSAVRGVKAKPKAPATDGAKGTKRDAPPKLTAEELAMAEQFGMTAEEYVAFKDPNPKLPAKKDTKDQ